MSRAATVGAFLAAHGYGGARREALPADASFRRYERLIGGPAPALLMDAPPPEDTRAFADVAGRLRAVGVAVPDVLAADHAAGLLIVGDFGHAMLTDEMPKAGVGALPEAARVLAAVHRADAAGLPAWDATAMANAALGTLCDWWWPAARGGPMGYAVRAEFADALATMLAPLSDGPRGFVHRDYFAGNLMRLADGRVGVLDFQSASVGHPAYDLVSLIEDNRRPMAASEAEAAVAAYLTARPELDHEEMASAMAICAAQRHLRVACQWVRLAVRDGRPGYLRHGARTWALLERALARPEAAVLTAAMDRHVPAALRGNPAGLGA